MCSMFFSFAKRPASEIASSKVQVPFLTSPFASLSKASCAPAIFYSNNLWMPATRSLPPVTCLLTRGKLATQEFLQFHMTGKSSHSIGTLHSNQLRHGAGKSSYFLRLRNASPALTHS